MLVSYFSEKHGYQPQDNLKKIHRELFSPILDACDNVRQKLCSANIHIKVRYPSYWFFKITNKSKILWNTFILTSKYKQNSFMSLFSSILCQCFMITRQLCSKPYNLMINFFQDLKKGSIWNVEDHTVKTTQRFSG